MQTDAAAIAAALRDLLAEGAAIWIPADAETNRAALASLLDAYEAAARGEPDAATRELAAEVAEWRALASGALAVKLGALRRGGDVRPAVPLAGDTDSPRAIRAREQRRADRERKIQQIERLLAKAGWSLAAEEAATE